MMIIMAATGFAVVDSHGSSSCRAQPRRVPGLRHYLLVLGYLASVWGAVEVRSGNDWRCSGTSDRLSDPRFGVDDGRAVPRRSASSIRPDSCSSGGARPGPAADRSGRPARRQRRAHPGGWCSGELAATPAQMRRSSSTASRRPWARARGRRGRRAGSTWTVSPLAPMTRARRRPYSRRSTRQSSPCLSATTPARSDASTWRVGSRVPSIGSRPSSCATSWSRSCRHWRTSGWWTAWPPMRRTRNAAASPVTSTIPSSSRTWGSGWVSRRHARHWPSRLPGGRGPTGRLAELTEAIQNVPRLVPARTSPIRGKYGGGLLDAGLRRLCTRFSEATGVHVDAQVEEPTLRNDPASAAGVFQMVAEALSNVPRHTAAAQVDVRNPDGRRTGSCSPFRTTPPQQGAHPLLPRSLAERAASLGGTLRVDQPAAGTTTVESRFHSGSRML